MARLNEPPQPTESVEALKRRFVRQNRDLAKSNSAQSLRIRTLEAETSRLLSDNISLREQLIKLQTEADNQRRQYVVNEVGVVKDRLEEKVRELSAFVSELGGLQDRVQGGVELHRGPRGGKPSPQQSPDQKNWKNAFTLAEITASQDGRLPPIIEDKPYPRLTLGHDELARLLSDPINENDSPDLGPPPITHFVEEDPIKFDPGERYNEYGQGLEGIHDISATLSTNLETRKKRRDSAGVPDFKRASRFEPRIGQVKETPSAIFHDASEQPLRATAKRKLDTRDVEERYGSARAPRADDFTFQRNIGTASSTSEEKEPENITSTEARISNKITQDLAAARGAKRDRMKGGGTISALSGRQALGPKSVNTDPMSSPVKSNRATVIDQIADLKKDAARRAGSKERSREKKPTITNSNPIKAPQQEPEDMKHPTDAQDPPPDTPASLDLLSPLPSEPSAVRPESQDTPPPSDLTCANDGANAVGRPSRRPRGTVSYAEPSLNTKMRRPTKELVDAVTGEGRNQRASSVKHERARSESQVPASAADKEKLRTVIIKKEAEPDQAWKKLPLAPSSQHQQIRAEAVSPLGTKVGTASENLPPSIMTQRGRRASTLQPIKLPDDVVDSELQTSKLAPSGSAAAISALIAGSKRAGRDKSRRKDDVGLDQALEKLNIYDLQHSSSPAEEGTGSKETLSKDRVKRRQSTLAAAPTVASSSSELGMEDEKVDSNETGLTTRVRDAQRDVHVRPVKSGIAGFAGDGAGSLRAERAASRRRSMML